MSDTMHVLSLRKPEIIANVIEYLWDHNHPPIKFECSVEELFGEPVFVFRFAEKENLELIEKLFVYSEKGYTSE